MPPLHFYFLTQIFFHHGKVFLLSLLGLIGLIRSCPAQTLDSIIRHIYEPLDKSAVQSGILIDQTPVFLWPGRYDGHRLTDSLRLDLDAFGLLYGQFRGASVGRSYLPDPVIYLDRSRKLPQASNEVPLMFMATRYDRIRQGAQEAGLLDWREGQLHDVKGRHSSPYVQDTCFAFAALRQKVRGRTVQFHLPSALIFNNLGWDIGAVQMDFGDGRGFQRLQCDGEAWVTFPEAGEKTLTLRYQHEGRTFETAAYLTVENVEVSADERGGLMSFDTVPNEVVNLGGTTLSLFYSCDDHKLRKPLIVVEGFGGTFTFKSMIDLLKLGNANGQPLDTWLNLHEYDLIWVDLTDPFASVSDNGNALIQALTWINARKHADESSEPNAMIGASMGGLVGKYALLKMHNELGKDSEVEIFFTYDSPLKGANFPIGLQAFIRDIVYNAESVGASTASLANALLLLDSPAAKDMLMARVEITGGVPLSFSTNPAFQFDILQYDIDQLELVQPLGSITRHIVLANGADGGIMQESIEPIQKILDFWVALDEADGAPGPEACYNVQINAEAFAATDQTTLIYRRTIEVGINAFCEPFADDQTYEAILELSSPIGLDNAPGGIGVLGLDDIAGGLPVIAQSLPNLLSTTSDFNLECYSFIPTVSALGNPVGTNPSTSFPCGASGAARCSASDDNLQENPATGEPEFNQGHVTMNGRIATVITEELLAGSQVAGLAPTLNSTEIYNFGKTNNVAGMTTVSTPRTVAQDLIIQNNAQLWINRNDRIGYTGGNTPLNHKPQFFSVFVPGIDCAGGNEAKVTVESGGRIVIGDYQNGVKNIGKMFFQTGSELEVSGTSATEAIKIEDKSLLSLNGPISMKVNSNAFITAINQAQIITSDGALTEFHSYSKLNLENGSTMVVEEGSTLHFYPESILRISGDASSLIIYEGATLILDPGAIVRLELPGAKIRIEGRLIVNGDIDFAGTGYFEFAGSNQLEYGPGYTTLRLAGAGIAQHFIRIESELRVPAGRNIDLRQGAVQIDGVRRAKC